MSQYDFGTIDPATKSGTALANDLNNWRDAVHSSHIGAARPAYVKAGMIWVDVSAAPVCYVKLFDGTGDIPIASFNNSSHTGGAVATAAGVTFAPVGNLAATNVQAGLQELDTEKYDKAGGIVAGDVTVNGALYAGNNSGAWTGVPTVTGLKIQNSGAVGYYMRGIGGTQFIGYSSAGTLAAPAPVGQNGALVAMYGGSWVPSGWQYPVGMFMETAQAHTDTARGTRIRFSTTQNGTTALAERMMINDNGFVGIGVTPGVKLDVNGSIRSLSGAIVGSFNQLVMSTKDGAADQGGAIALRDNASGYNAGGIEYYSGGAERMRITGAGAVLIGTASVIQDNAAGVLCVAANTGNPPMRLRSVPSPGGMYWQMGPDVNNAFILYNHTGTGMYIVDGGQAWNQGSDERLKTDLVPIDGPALWDWFKTVRTENGRLNTDEAGTERAFLIAQDWTERPEVTNVRDDGMLGLAATNTLPYAYAVLKVAMGKIEALEARVKTLEAKQH